MHQFYHPQLFSFWFFIITYVILVLHLIAILISENIFLWHIVAAFIIFVSVAVFGAVFLFQSPKTIATALITSRLDYCNSLLYNIASKDILKLQGVQTCLTRIVTWSPQFSHSIPLLKSLHWLPTQSRIIFKSALLPIKLFLLENFRIYVPCFL